MRAKTRARWRQPDESLLIPLTKFGVPANLRIVAERLFPFVTANLGRSGVFDSHVDGELCACKSLVLGLQHDAGRSAWRQASVSDSSLLGYAVLEGASTSAEG